MPAVIARLVPAVLRHLEAYAEVAGEDAREAGAIIARRVLVLLVAAAAAFIALMMFCAWLLVLAWETPWRAWVAGGLALGFAAMAAALAIPVIRRSHKPHRLFFSRIRTELGRDRELITRAFERPERAGNGEDHAPN
jgi:uncharacterized membrane protein YqjE